jgi:hypothetical protein
MSMTSPAVLKAAVAACLLAFALWLACWLGHADPFLRWLIVVSPLALAGVVVCLHAVIARRRWWALIPVAAALWAYLPIVMLFTLGLGH